MKLKACLISLIWTMLVASGLGLETKMKAESSLPEKGCSISVTIDGYNGGNVKFLGVSGDRNFLMIPEFTVSDQKIVIEQKDPFPEGLYYLVFEEKKYIRILLDRDQHFSMRAQNGDLVNSMHIEGSLDNRLLYQNLRYEYSHLKKFEKVQEKITAVSGDKKTKDELEKKLEALINDKRIHIQKLAKEGPDSFFVKFKRAGQNPVLEHPTLSNGEVDKEKQIELCKAKFWDSYDFNDIRLLRTPVYHNKLEQYIKKLTPQRIDNVIESADFIMGQVPKNTELCMYTVSYLCLEYGKSTIMGGEAIFVHMVDTYLNDEYVAKLDKKEMEKARDDADKIRPSLLGKIGQNITCFDPENRPLSLYDIDSPIIVVYIYNVLCEHCLEETPELFEVYKEWRDRGVDVFALSTNRDIDVWKDYIAKEKLTWHNVIDPHHKSKFYTKYRVDVTPEIYVLNANREIIGMNLKPYQLDSILEKAFSQ